MLDHRAPDITLHSTSNTMADVGVNGGNMSSMSSKQQTSSIIIQPPITKLGQGPGLILLVDDPAASQITSSDCLDPCPRLKWAEEGYLVAELMISDQSDFVLGFSKTISALKQHPANNGKQGLGVICKFLEERCSKLWPKTNALL